MTNGATALGRIDWKTVRDAIDLAAVATDLLGPPPGRYGARDDLWWNCPFHEDRNPSFHITPDGTTWKCFGCGAHGDAVALVMKSKTITFHEAVADLTERFTPSGTAGTPRPKLPGQSSAPPRPPERPRAERSPPPSGLPEADALALVDNAERRLWTPEGADALAYLHGRGLTDETIRAARLGVTPRVTIPKTNGTTFKALGVVIPWFASGRLTLVKLRQPEERQPKYKYVEAYRDPARLTFYPGPQVIRPGRPLIIVEGEFDALLLGQELGDLAPVVTLGSASTHPTPALRSRMHRAFPWFIATDADDAGDTAADGWPSLARRARPPILRPHPDDHVETPKTDWTDLFQHGVNLRRWWTDRLGGNETPPLFSWEELARERWGPAAADPTPGIIIDRPDQTRKRAALRSANPSDPYTLAQREAVPAEGEEF